MKYRIILHFSSHIEKIVDRENENDINSEKDKFYEEVDMNEVAQGLTYDGWNYEKEQ